MEHGAPKRIAFCCRLPSLMLRGLAPPPMAFTQEQQRGLFGGNESGAQAAHGQGLVHAVQDAILKQKNPERPMSWQTLAISSGMWDRAPPRRAAVV